MIKLFIDATIKSYSFSCDTNMTSIIPCVKKHERNEQVKNCLGKELCVLLAVRDK